MNKSLFPVLLSSLFLASAQVQAQDADRVDQAGQGLSLFEGIEVAEDRDRANSRTPRESRVTTNEPEFTLLGTSRVGDQYSAILRHRSGESILVQSKGNTASAVTGHAGYSVLRVGAGTLSLRYPAGVPCQENVDHGVRCGSNPNTAELELSASEPLNRPASAQALDQERIERNDGIEPDVQSTNPFEALRAAQADADNPAAREAARNNRFVPRRIEPSEVPPGMRIVSTPFGDRLVEE